MHTYEKATAAEAAKTTTTATVSELKQHDTYPRINEFQCWSTAFFIRRQSCQRLFVFFLITDKHTFKRRVKREARSSVSVCTYVFALQIWHKRALFSQPIPQQWAQFNEWSLCGFCFNSMEFILILTLLPCMIDCLCLCYFIAMKFTWFFSFSTLLTFRSRIFEIMHKLTRCLWLLRFSSHFYAPTCIDGIVCCCCRRRRFSFITERG